MSGIEAAGLALGIISAIISIIDATSKVYEAVKDEAGLPTNFKKSAIKLPLISKLLEDAERYVKAADEATETAFTPTLEDCKAQATQLQELFEKVMPEEGESRWDRYVKAARTIGKGGRVEDLVGGILDDLQLLATRFPEVTTPRTKEQLAKAVEEVTKMEPSLPDGFEQMPAYAHYGSGAQNNNTGSGTQHINSGTGNQNSGSGQQFIGTNHIVHNYALRTIDSAASDGNVYFKVPRTVNSLFTGRTELLVRIQAVLRRDTSSSNRQKRFVITGLGGQGKSELCLQAANLLKDDFWGIFWVDVDKPSTADRDFIAIAELLGHAIKTVPEALQVLATTHRSWLLILDNADHTEFDYQVYFPPGNHGAVLMTSRVAECRQYSPDAFEALGGLGEGDSRKLLLKAAGLSPGSWPSHENQAKEVVKLLGSHTLALIQAGAYINQDHCQLHQYPEVYQRQRQRLLKYRPKQAQSRYRDVYATFEASADILEKSRNESAADALQLLEILSMLDSSVLPLQIFEEAWKGGRKISQAVDETRDIDEFSQDHLSHLPSFMILEESEWDPFRLTEASCLLASLSLVTQQDLEGCMGLSMHPLTHAWAKDRQDSKSQGVAWIATGCVLGLSRSSTRLWQTQERRLLSHILSYLDIKFKKAFSLASTAVVTPLFLECGWALLQMRQDSRLSQLLQDIFLELRQEVNEPSEDFLPLYELQARSFINLGKNKAARVLLERVIKIQEITLGKTHPSTLTTMGNLALVLDSQGKYAEAEAMNRQTFEIREEVLGKTHPDTLTTMSNLAGVLSRQGKYAEAEAMNRQTLEISEEVLGKTHPSTLTTMGNLALVLDSQGKYAEAEAMNRQTLEIREEVLGKTHPSTLTTMGNLALVLDSQGKYAEAEAMNRQTLEIREEVLGKTHPSTLTSVYCLAYSLESRREFEEASLLYQRACTGYKLSLGPEHPTTKACLNHYSIMLKSLEEVR